MYTIMLGNYLVFDAANMNGYEVLDPTFTQSVNSPGELTFKLPPTHPCYNRIEKLSSVLSIYKNGRLIWEGRVLEDKQNMRLEKEIYAEGVLAYLYDSTIRPFDDGDYTVASLFGEILSLHNEQVTQKQRFEVGNVNVVDVTDVLIKYQDDYRSTWDTIKKNMIELMGGYLVVRYQDGVRYLDYLEDFTDTATQTIHFGENMLDLFVKSSGAETYTACIPLGAKLEGEDQRLDIGEVNDGKDYIINQTLAERFGVIYAPIKLTTWDGIEDALKLKSLGDVYLNLQATRFTETVEVKAIDLSNLTPDIASFAFGDYVRVVSELHDLERTYMIRALSMPLDDPAKAVFTLGETSLSLTDSNLKNERDALERIENVEKNYITDDKMTTVLGEVLENNSAIIQTAQEIMLSVVEEYTSLAEFEEYKELMETTFQMTAEGININFEKIIASLTELENGTSQQLTEISRYIRFVDGAIVLGSSDSEIKLRIENDILYFFSGADDAANRDNAWAYMSSGKLYITDAQMLGTVQIGRFSFLPRESGNLTFTKVV